MGPISVPGLGPRMGRDRGRLGSSGSHHWPQPRPRPSSQAPDAPAPCGAEVQAWARATGLAIGRMVAVTVQSRSPHAPLSQPVLEMVLERITYATEDAGCIIARGCDRADRPGSADDGGAAAGRPGVAENRPLVVRRVDIDRPALASVELTANDATTIKQRDREVAARHCHLPPHSVVLMPPVPVGAQGFLASAPR
jgi:hypothetical protein